jgi:hypothetical protein
LLVRYSRQSLNKHLGVSISGALPPPLYLQHPALRARPHSRIRWGPPDTRAPSTFPQGGPRGISESKGTTCCRGANPSAATPVACPACQHKPASDATSTAPCGSSGQSTPQAPAQAPCACAGLAPAPRLGASRSLPVRRSALAALPLFSQLQPLLRHTFGDTAGPGQAHPSSARLVVRTHTSHPILTADSGFPVCVASPIRLGQAPRGRVPAHQHVAHKPHPRLRNEAVGRRPHACSWQSARTRRWLVTSWSSAHGKRAAGNQGNHPPCAQTVARPCTCEVRTYNTIRGGSAPTQP